LKPLGDTELLLERHPPSGDRGTVEALPARKIELFIVGSDRELFDPTTRSLEAAGHRVKLIARGSSAVAACGRRPPDLLVLDAELPDVSGLDVCRMLRAQPGTAEMPIVMLSPSGSDDDRVAGLEAGADDFLTKPVSARELVLRVERLGVRRPRQVAREPGQLRSGAVEIDVDGVLAYVDGEERNLTLIEFRLLRFLVENEGKALSRAAILEHVWNNEPDAGSRTIDTHVKRLRQKLGGARGSIETVRGIGYRYRAR
jgi:two-component system phosphate regulon response regulator PhoB